MRNMCPVCKGYTSLVYLLPSGSEQHEVLLFGSTQTRHCIVQIQKTALKIGTVG